MRQVLLLPTSSQGTQPIHQGTAPSCQVQQQSTNVIPQAGSTKSDTLQHQHNQPPTGHDSVARCRPHTHSACFHHCCQYRLPLPAKCPEMRCRCLDSHLLQWIQGFSMWNIMHKVTMWNIMHKVQSSHPSTSTASTCRSMQVAAKLDVGKHITT